MLSTAGNNTWAGPIVLNGSGFFQTVANSSATLVLSGPIAVGGGGFTGTLNLRGASTGANVVSGQITRAAIEEEEEAAEGEEADGVGGGAHLGSSRLAAGITPLGGPGS